MFLLGRRVRLAWIAAGVGAFATATCASLACTSLTGLSGGVVADAGSDTAVAPLCNGADTLRDAANCGRCGHDCAGGPCASGRCLPVVLATGQPGVEDLARGPDGTLYWANLGDGSIVAMSKGGLPSTLATNQLGPTSIAVDATRIVWTSQSGGTIASFINKTVRTEVTGQTDPFDLALDGTTIAWVNRSAGEVVARRDGEPPRRIAGAQAKPTAIAIGDGAAYWTVEGSGVGSGAIVRATLDGASAPTTLASGLQTPQGVAYSAGTIFATSLGGTGDEPSVVSVPASGGPVTTLARGQLRPHGIAADALFVYWLNDRDGGEVMAVARAGGEPVALAKSQKNPRALVLDETSVYFANAGDGSISRVAKP